jgi:histone deacetylase HOS3
MSAPLPLPLALCIQPACFEHKYIRHSNSSHIFERPERLRAVLLGFASALARLEAVDGLASGSTNDDLADLLSSLSMSSKAFAPPTHINLILPPPPPSTPGQILLHHPALQLAHYPPEEAPFPYLPKSRGAALPSSSYLRDLFKWASEAVENIHTTGCEIPEGKDLNPGDLYLGPGSILAIEGSVSGELTEWG